MVKRGMKKGDKFEDGGLTYVVLSVNADGSYVSTLAKNVKSKGTQPAAEVEKDAEITEDNTVDEQPKADDAKATTNVKTNVQAAKSTNQGKK